MVFTPSSAAKPGLRFRLFELLCAAIVPFLALGLRNPHQVLDWPSRAALEYTFIGFCCTVLGFLLFGSGNVVIRHFGFHDAMRMIKISIFGVIGTVAVLFVTSRLDGIPRSVPLIHLSLLITSLVGGYNLFVAYWSHALWNRKAVEAGPRIDVAHLEGENILILGADRLAVFYIQLIGALAGETRKVIGILDNDKALHGRSIAGCPVIGDTDALERIVLDFRNHGVAVTTIAIADTLNINRVWGNPKVEHIAETYGLKIINLVKTLGLEQLIPEPALAGAKAEIAKLGTAHHVGDQTSVSRPPRFMEQLMERRAQSKFWSQKRAFDFLAATVLIIALLPVFAVTSIAIFISMGAPLFFWQQRAGKNGRPFYILKFRTMLNAVTEDGRPIPDEQRLPLIGKWLRLTRLDELPQLWNILRGDMSIIGPRPLLPVDQPENVAIRLSVLPGITGWAQVCGGKAITAEEKDALDQWYIAHASLAIEVRILIRTFKYVLGKEIRDEHAIAEAFKFKRGLVSKEGISKPMSIPELSTAA